jgi:hypothetical protein
MTHDITLKYPKHPASLEVVFHASLELLALVGLLIVVLLVKKPIGDWIWHLITKRESIK